MWRRIEAWRALNTANELARTAVEPITVSNGQAHIEVKNVKVDDTIYTYAEITLEAKRAIYLQGGVVPGPLDALRREVGMGYNPEGTSVTSAPYKGAGIIENPGQFVRDLRVARRTMRAELGRIIIEQKKSK